MNSIVITTGTDLRLEAVFGLMSKVDVDHVFICAYGPNKELLDINELIHMIKKYAPNIDSNVVIERIAGTRSNAINQIFKTYRLLDKYENVFVASDRVFIASPVASELIRAFTSETFVDFYGNSVCGLAGDVAISAPCTNFSDSEHQVVNLTKDELSEGLQGYSGRRYAYWAGKYSLASWVGSDFVCINQRARRALVNGELLDVELESACWQDLCFRLASIGLKCAVSEASFVAVDTDLDNFPQRVGSIADRTKFLAKHESSKKTSFAVVIESCLKTVRDINMLRNCLYSCREIADTVIVINKNNPLEIQSSPDFNASRKTGLGTQDEKLLRDCDNKDKAGVIKALTKWCKNELGGKAKSICLIPDTSSIVDYKNQCIKYMERNGFDGYAMLHHDECVSMEFDRDAIDNFLNHPDPLICAADCSVVYHWNTIDTVRSETPYSYGKDYSDGPSDTRMFRRCGKKFPLINKLKNQHSRMIGPQCAPGQVVVFAGRIRNFSVMRQSDRLALGVSSSTENIVISSYTEQCRLGFHFLCYEKENAHDVERWLCLMSTVSKKMVMVWTGSWEDSDKAWYSEGRYDLKSWPKTGPGRELSAVCKIYNCDIIHCPLNNNISSARNAGIHHLRIKSCQWGVFFDPDEWLENPFDDLRAIRNMTNSDRSGYMFKVANHRPDGRVSTLSETIRMSNLSPLLNMMMNGRVHEGFQNSLKHIQSIGIHPRLTYAPFTVQHRGLAQDSDTMNEKLDKYEKLLRLDIQDDAKNSGAWVSLGLHYLNEKEASYAEECFENAIDCAGESYLPFKEMAFLKLRDVKQLMSECRKRVPKGHQFYALCSEMDNWLTKYAPAHPIVDRGREVEVLPLPEYASKTTHTDIE